MTADGPMLVLLMLGVIALLGVLIVGGLIHSRRSQARNLRDVRAADVEAYIGAKASSAQVLLYGVWQLRWDEVILRVRDQRDVEVGNITRGPGGTVIAIDRERFAVRATSGWTERAELVTSPIEGGADGAPACSFAAGGWGGNRIARYTWAGAGELTVRGRWSVPWRRTPLEICQSGRVIGRLAVIGSAAVDKGRVLVLPSTIPLQVRLFVLWKAVGARTRTRSQ
jgi:hypothetical protein